MIEIQSELSEIIFHALWLQIEPQNIVLQTPPRKEFWDLCFWVFDIVKILRISPHVVTQKIVDFFQSYSQNTLIDALSVEWPYINIKIWKEYYTQMFSDFFLQKDYYKAFHGQSWAKETIIIDYIGANVWKPLHIGHMCTPLQGQVCANVFTKLWYQVITDSHIGDWGIIFWKLIVAYKKYGDEQKLVSNAVEHLFELYVLISHDAEEDTNLDAEFRAAFKLLSEWNSELVELWKKFTASSIYFMNILLWRLFVKPDYNIWESFYEWLGLPKMENYPDLTYSMKDIVEELIVKWIATKNDDNSVWVVFSEASKLPSCILQKRDGTHGYLASDLACIKYRVQNWNPQKILYFVDVRQQLHFRQAFMIARLAWWVPDTTELTHAHNWFISLKDGAMSTRKGRIIKLWALLDEAHVRAKNIILEKRSDISEENMQILAEKVWIWAIKYGYLKKSRELDSVFDWDEFMTFEWNSGPYIQYGYVRAKKILSEYTFQEISYVFSEDIEVQLIQKLLDFPDIIHEIKSEYNFHQLCLYIYELTKIFSTLYAKLPILSENNMSVRNSRCALLMCFTEIIEESFSLLWIELPLEM